ncbi:glyoxylate/hydroxypyruvate reductase A [Cognatishimia sp. WU-CL00825]|uniref:2-hydroxyacid dehydrogenase n=1 Tax=Cognatishimia sp. WU-CL00825 TaxID=3127658 RepID=UPI003104C83B
MINVLFAAGTENWTDYQSPLIQAFQAADLDVDLSLSHAPQQTDYIIYAPSSDLQDFAPYQNCKAVLSLWAGVEKIVSNQSLTMPLCRMVDPGLTQGMVEWVTGHCLRYHLNIDASLATPNGIWQPKVPPLAQERHITILGLGQLGQACAIALSQLGFQVTGWSRSPKTLANVTCTHGQDGLQQALSTAEILILLLPNTPATDNTLNAKTLAQLPQSARIINPGRGSLIEDAALLDALNSDHIAHATLDVFRQEPLPATDPYWAHPKVTVTPHIAADTRASTASQVIAENIRRGQAQQPLLHLVDRSSGY